MLFISVPCELIDKFFQYQQMLSSTITYYVGAN